MARFYTYVNPAEIEAQFDDDEKKNLEKMNVYSTVTPVSQTQMWISGSKWRMDWVQDFCPLMAGHSDGKDFQIVNQKALF